MKHIKIIATAVFAVLALSFSACSSKKTASEGPVYNSATTETPVVEQPAPMPEEKPYLGASSSGLGL